MHPYPVGTQVETNEEYFQTYGRRVIGTSVALNPMPPKEITIVQWEFQEGNIIPDHEGNSVVMLTKDLQRYIPQRSKSKKKESMA